MSYKFYMKLYILELLPYFRLVFRRYVVGFIFSLSEYFRELMFITIYHVVKRDVFINVTWQHILSGN